MKWFHADTKKMSVSLFGSFIKLIRVQCTKTWVSPRHRISETRGGQLGTRHQTPAWLRLGSASARLGSAAQGPGNWGTGTCRPASHPPRPSHPALLTAPPVRQTVSTAAVLTGSRLTARRSPGPGQRRPGGQLDVSARQARDSRLPPP